MRDGDVEPAPEAPFHLELSQREHVSPVVFASPHSGRFYPADMGAAAAVTWSAIRRSEDAHVDWLLARAPRHGFALICATYGRAYVDLNRAPDELDPAMFADPLPPGARPRTARVAAGLGAIARVAGEGLALYDRKLSWEEAQARLERVHRPYHAALQRLLARTLERFGRAILIDWHSMPSAAVKIGGRPGPDFVLGDRFGAACDGELTTLVERQLKGLGFTVARNAPYAGGYTTETYGRPGQGVHALQIEVNRALYLDEATMAPNAGASLLEDALERLFQQLSSANWCALVRGAQKNRAQRAR
jgi:N-formylglutamate amidohydrolase